MNVVEGLSQREVARRLGISRNTVRKYWDGGVIPGACKPRKRDPVVMTEDVISAIKRVSMRTCFPFLTRLCGLCTIATTAR
ncbi:MAG: helix-turn-helix domain-containing protein [Limnochordia bacterium]|nr:helix-turn-helix domain-containing protein [Limnochordia bacterium]